MREEKNSTDYWDGVRNYQARNVMRRMKIGDKGFFYHSNAKKDTGIVGIVEVVKEAYPDPTQNAEDKEKDRWSVVDIKLLEKWKNIVTLQEMKELAKVKDSPLADMTLLKTSRLSVQPVTKDEWEYIVNVLRVQN